MTERVRHICEVVLEEFVASRKDLGLPASLQDGCGMAALLLCRTLRELNVEPMPIISYGVYVHHVKGWGDLAHQWVEWDGYLLDLTASQFMASSKPFVWMETPVPDRFRPWSKGDAFDTVSSCFREDGGTNRLLREAQRRAVERLK